MPPPAPSPDLPSSRKANRFVAFTAFLSAFIGLLALVGWQAHITFLIQLRPGFAPMQFNTALCFFLAGFALYAATRNWKRSGCILSAIVTVVGGVTITEYLTGKNLGIDQLFFRAYITVQTSHPGRMSPVSALCMFLAGLALIVLHQQKGAKWWTAVAGALASMVIALCGIAILGYLIGLEGTYGWGHLSRIAFHTAGALAILGSGIFVLAWTGSLENGAKTPPWLAPAVFLNVLTASVVLCQALVSKQNQEIAETVQAGAESATNQLAVRVEARVRSIVRMAHRWEFSGQPLQAAWENDAQNYIYDFPDIQAIEWIDSSRVTRWVQPLEGNEAKLNHDQIEEEQRRQAVETAAQTKEPAITPIVELFRGGSGFIVYVPIWAGAKFDGWIACVFKAQQIFDRYLSSGVARGNAISLSQGGKVFYERSPGPAPSNAAWVVNSRIDLHGSAWDVRVWPTPALMEKLDSPLPEIVLIGGICGALLLAATILLAQHAARHARAVIVANHELEAALAEVKTLEGLLPICAYCKRVRDDTGYWQQIESYLTRHSAASFSHGSCPECAVKAFESFGLEVPEQFRAELEARNFE